MKEYGYGLHICRINTLLSRIENNVLANMLTNYPDDKLEEYRSTQFKLRESLIIYKELMQAILTNPKDKDTILGYQKTIEGLSKEIVHEYLDAEALDRLIELRTQLIQLHNKVINNAKEGNKEEIRETDDIESISKEVDDIEKNWATFFNRVMKRHDPERKDMSMYRIVRNIEDIVIRFHANISWELLDRIEEVNPYRMHKFLFSDEKIQIEEKCEKVFLNDVLRFIRKSLRHARGSQESDQHNGMGYVSMNGSIDKEDREKILLQSERVLHEEAFLLGETTYNKFLKERGEFLVNHIKSVSELEADMIYNVFNKVRKEYSSNISQINNHPETTHSVYVIIDKYRKSGLISDELLEKIKRVNPNRLNDFFSGGSAYHFGPDEDIFTYDVMVQIRKQEVAKYSPIAGIQIQTEAIDNSIDAFINNITQTDGNIEYKENDMVNSPSHYQILGIEVIDIIKASLTPEEFRGYLKGNVIKYVHRAENKNGLEDYFKGRWYINRLEVTVKEEEELDE